ncbi:MAG: hypothetical protein JW781_04585 [Deltaproteobacteria bacterium]|nr:hypothetical protein [Candidatus Anaeroferrophillacea bacterium]
MDKKTILAELESLLARQGITVSYENFQSQHIRRRRGLCRHEDRYLLIISDREKPDDRIAAVCEVLRHFDLETIYLPPKIRALLELPATCRT